MKSQLVPIKTLHPSTREAMYTLLVKHFTGVAWEVFQADLEHKNWVLLFTEQTSTDPDNPDPDNPDPAVQQLLGFSTLRLCQMEFNQQLLSVVYSGDTIMDPIAWSSSALPRAWIAAINYLRQCYPSTPLYWLLICSGFRTYRFLPTFWRSFYPCYHTKTPDSMARLMAHLAWAYYGDCYHELQGIVRFKRPQILRDKLVEIPTGRQTNPHVQFFVAQNPHYYQGDELVCLTEIHYDNLTRAGQRMWQAESPLEFEEGKG